MNSAPMASSAQLSEANTVAPLGIAPIQSGRNPWGISCCDQLGRRGKYKGVCAFQPVHCSGNCVFNRVGPETLLNDDIGNHFRVCCRVKNGAHAFQLMSQDMRICQIPVVSQCQLPLVMVDSQRLCIPPAVTPGRAVTYMSNCDIPFAKALQAIGREHLRYQAHVSYRCYDPIVIQGDSGALLAAMLQGRQGIISQIRKLCPLRRTDPEYAAFLVEHSHFMNPAGACSFLRRLPPRFPDPDGTGLCQASRLSCCPRTGRYPG